MPSPKQPCPTCGGPMDPRSQQCRSCKPTYERTPENRARMSAATTGKPRPWLQGRKRPGHGEKMRALWTPERREAKRQEMLARNPLARYHGLSAKAAKRLTTAAGRCQACGKTGRLDIHHQNRNKHDHSPENLMVLCHRCHMQEHARSGETGWHVYHRKRKTTPN